MHRQHPCPMRAKAFDGWFAGRLFAWQLVAFGKLGQCGNGCLFDGGAKPGDAACQNDVKRINMKLNDKKLLHIGGGPVCDKDFK